VFSFSPEILKIAIVILGILAIAYLEGRSRKRNK